VGSTGYKRSVSLIQAVAKVRPTIVVLHSGSPLDVSPWIDSVQAVVQSWFMGQEMGNALLDVINGTVNPSGKLPFSWPKKLEDNPTIGNFPATRDLEVEYQEGVFVGYRHYLTKGIATQFCFGAGLSYTTFKLSNLQVTPSGPMGPGNLFSVVKTNSCHFITWMASPNLIKNKF
jgi:beta-glucosidase